MRGLLFAVLPVVVACGDSGAGTGGGGGQVETGAGDMGGAGAGPSNGAGAPGGAAPSGGGESGGNGSGGESMVRGDVCTDFALDENPISEDGLWQEQGGLTGLDWSNVQSQNGIAFGTQTGFDGYNDSIALLGGFGPDHRISAVLHFSGERSEATQTHEVELILRGDYEANDQHIYECNIGYAGPSGWYAQIMLLDGPIGTFTEITQGINAVPDIQDGDIFTAEVVGNEIRTYLNDLQLASAPADALTSGQPGIGFFWRGTENVNDFGFASVCATAL